MDYPYKMTDPERRNALALALMGFGNNLLQPTPYKRNFLTSLSDALNQGMGTYQQQQMMFQKAAADKAAADLAKQLGMAQISHLNAQTAAIGQPKPLSPADAIKLAEFNQEQQGGDVLRRINMAKPYGAEAQGGINDLLSELAGTAPKMAMEYEKQNKPKEAKEFNIPGDLDTFLAQNAGRFKIDYSTPEGRMTMLRFFGDPNTGLGKAYNAWKPSLAPQIYNVVPTSEGLQPFSVRTGTAKGGPIGGKPLSNEMITAEQQLGTLKETTERVKNLYKPEYVGPAAGRIAGLKEVTVGVPAEQANFNADVAQMQNTLVYLMSGKQINEQEYERLKRQLPDKNLPSNVFKARMENFDNTLNSIIENRHKMSGGYGNIPTGEPAAQKKSRFTVKELP